jgi:hypothetical protein
MDGNNDIVTQQWAVYRYGSDYYIGTTPYPINSYRPLDGQLMVISGTPYFSGMPVLIHGYGNHTVAELVENVAAQATTADVLAAVAAEITARQQAIAVEALARQLADATLQGSIDGVQDIALGASVALVFDNRVQLNAWMGGTVVPGITWTPADLRNGWKALMRTLDEPDLWWDGEDGVWRDLEAKTDLSSYRTAAEQDQIDENLKEYFDTNLEVEEDAREHDVSELQNSINALNNALALKANIDSEALTGIPKTTTPDGSILAQIANVEYIKAIAEKIQDELDAVLPTSYTTLDRVFLKTLDGKQFVLIDE